MNDKMPDEYYNHYTVVRMLLEYLEFRYSVDNDGDRIFVSVQPSNEFQGKVSSTVHFTFDRTTKEILNLESYLED